MKKKLFRKLISVAIVLTIVTSGYEVSAYEQLNNTNTSNLQEKQSDEVYVVKELKDERTENSNTYLLSDGTKKTEIYADNIRYEENGELIEDNTKLDILTSDDKIVLDDKTDADIDKFRYEISIFFVEEWC